jgi:uncharacterized protein YbjT (DUF2867 family)
MERPHRVLVLGASGLIGSLLVPALARNGHYVIAVSRHKPQSFDATAGKVKVVLVRCDRDFSFQLNLTILSV